MTPAHFPRTEWEMAAQAKRKEKRGKTEIPTREKKRGVYEAGSRRCAVRFAVVVLKYHECLNRDGAACQSIAARWRCP